MAMIDPIEEGQTPLDEDEREGLLIPSILTRSDLNIFEQQNIEEALQWLIGRRMSASEVFENAFTCRLHRLMFGHVWKWAGKFRKTEKNIGIDPIHIPIELKKLNDDASYWFHHSTFSPEETAIRYKHRLVSIHCFANGNGRHSRLTADIIIGDIYKQELFTWGTNRLDGPGEQRKNYLAAIRAADRGDIKPLIAFARS
jgi:Fic-DOC domain mobile mystery protein B